MGEIDPRLTRLIDTLLGSALAPLAVDALARLENAEREPLLDREHDPFAPSSEEEPVQRASRQLDLLDTVITARIKLELDLLDSSTRLVRSLNASFIEGGRGSLETVVVTNAEPVALDAALRVQNPLDPARREHLLRLLEAWQSASKLSRGMINGSEG